MTLWIIRLPESLGVVEGGGSGGRKGFVQVVTSTVLRTPIVPGGEREKGEPARRVIRGFV